MTVVVALCALAMTTWVGYYLGRRAGSAPPTWRKRTSRIALGRLVISLLVSLTARRVRRGFRAERLLRDALGMRGPRTIASHEFLRSSVTRARSY